MSTPIVAHRWYHPRKPRGILHGNWRNGAPDTRPHDKALRAMGCVPQCAIEIGATPYAWALLRARDDKPRGFRTEEPNAEDLLFAEQDGDYFAPLFRTKVTP